MKAIYDNVTALLSEPAGRHRTFIVVETLFFSMWWEDPTTTDRQRAQFRQLLQNGQVEFVNGGWVMQDEISTMYDADINQMTLGHKWLVDNFGREHIPHVAWHIDPQGHVGATAARFAAMGFDAFVPNRIPAPLKQQLQKTQGLEFIWDGMAAQTSADRRADAQIFTHVLDEFGYDPPNIPRNLYFFDDYSYWKGERNMTEEPPITSTNVHAYVTRMAEFMMARAKWLATPNMLFPWGSDFEFQNCTAMYPNMDRVLEYINAHSEELGFTAEYSTLSRYFSALHQANHSWSTAQHGDFLPYSDPAPVGQHWWSGEFTSWPILKKRARRAASTLRSAELLRTAAVSGTTSHLSPAAAASADEGIAALRKAAAEVQHHDAVDGTSPGRVTAMWIRHLESAEAKASNASAVAAEALLRRRTSAGRHSRGQGQGQGGESPLLFADSRTLGKTLLSAGGKTAVVVVSNSLGFNRTEVLTLPVPAAVAGVRVTTADATVVPSQIRKASLPTDVWPGVTADPVAESELLLWVAVPALGFETLFIEASSTADRNSAPSANHHHDSDHHRQQQQQKQLQSSAAENDSIVLENQNLALMFSRASGGGGLRQLRNKLSGLVSNLTEGSMVWKTSGSDNYRFEPAALPARLNHSSINYETGPIASSVTQTVTDPAAPAVRVVQRWQVFHAPSAAASTASPTDATAAGDAAGATFVDVSQAVLGPLPVNTEVSSRIVCTDSSEPWSQNGSFWTDESGWFIRERHFKQGKEKASPAANIAANLVPCYGSAFVRRGDDDDDDDSDDDDDDDAQFTILSAHSHGCYGGRAPAGEVVLETFLARNPPGDDRSTVTSHFRWRLDSPSTAEETRLTSALQLQQPLLPLYGAADSRAAWLAEHQPSLAPLAAAATQLPPSVHLLSLDRWNTSHVLLRLQHLREPVGPAAGKPETVDVGDLLRGVGRLGAWVEMTLNAIHPREESLRGRLAWGDDAAAATELASQGFEACGEGQLAVTIQPLELRTWLVELR